MSLLISAPLSGTYWRYVCCHSERVRRLSSPLALHHVPVLSNDEPDHGIEVWLPAGAADVVKDCLGFDVVGGVDLSNLRIPLLNVTRIEALLNLFASDALLGHSLGDRAEQLVLGVFEALPDLSWVEARCEIGMKALQRGCVISKLGGALQPG